MSNKICSPLQKHVDSSDLFTPRFIFNAAISSEEIPKSVLNHFEKVEKVEALVTKSSKLDRIKADKSYEMAAAFGVHIGNTSACLAVQRVRDEKTSKNNFIFHEAESFLV